VSSKKQELFALGEPLRSLPVLGGVRGDYLFSFLCCVCSFVCLHSVSLFNGSRSWTEFNCY